jgi:hypothetical protein
MNPDEFGVEIFTAPFALIGTGIRTPLLMNKFLVVIVPNLIME